MTVFDALGVLVRRWYVVLFVLALTAGLGWAFARDGGLFVTRTVVTFVAPDSGPWDSIGSADRGVVLFASAVAAEANGGRSSLAYSSADAPYYGAGLREGIRVALPDTGGQWGVVYSRAAIVVDIVSADADWVRARQTEMIEAVERAARERQAGIPSRNRIVVAVEPLSETIADVRPGRMGQLLAGASLAVAGILIGGWAAVMWDRRAGGVRHIGEARGSRRLSGGQETI